MIKERHTTPEGLVNRNNSWSYLLLHKKRCLWSFFSKYNVFLRIAVVTLTHYSTTILRTGCQVQKRMMRVSEQENRQGVETSYQQQVCRISTRISLQLKISFGVLTSAEIFVQAKATAFSKPCSCTGCCRKLMEMTMFPDL